MDPEQAGRVSLWYGLFLLQKHRPEGLDNTFVVHTPAVWKLTQRKTKRVPSTGPLASICNNLTYPLTVNSQNYVLWT